MTQTSKLQARFTTAATAAAIVATTVDAQGATTTDVALAGEAAAYTDAATLLAKFEAEFGDAVQLDKVARKLAQRAQTADAKVQQAVAADDADRVLRNAAKVNAYMGAATDVARAFKRTR